MKNEMSDGLTASYYELPEGATELKHLIFYKNMNAQIGEIFRACYRYNDCPHSDPRRNLNKIIAYAKQEIERLDLLEANATEAKIEEKRDLMQEELAEFLKKNGDLDQPYKFWFA